MRRFSSNRSRRLATKWNIFFHYYAIIISMISGILLVPLYLKYIPLEIYGAWLATGNIIAWLTIADPGISDVLSQQVGRAFGAGETQKLNDLLGSGTLLSFIVSLLILILGLLFTENIFHLILIKDQTNIHVLKNAFKLAVIGSSLMIFSYGFTSFNQGMLSSIGIGLIYVVATITSLIINVLLLTKGFGLYAIPSSQIVSALILIIGNVFYIFWRYVQESLKFRFSINGIFVFAKLTGYNILGRLGKVISTQLDAFLVVRYIGAEIAPVLNLTKRGPELSKMFIERPLTAMLPAITNAWGSGEYDKVRINTSRLFTILLWILGLLFTGFIIMNKSFITLWVGVKFFAGHPINVAICVGIVLSVLSSISSNVFFALGNIKESSKMNFIQSIITVLALYLGVKYFGLIGLVMGQALSLIAFSAWYFPYKALTYIKYDSLTIRKMKKEIAIVILISVIIIFIYIKLISIKSWVAFFSTGAIIVFTYIMFLYLLSKSFRYELNSIIHLIRKKFRFS